MLLRGSARAAPRCYSTGTRKARIAVAGAGWWGQGWHLPHLHNHPDAEVAAIIDPQFETGHWNGQTTHWSGRTFLNRDKLGEKYSCPVFESIDDMLAHTDDLRLDGLLCSTNHTTHAELGIKAAKAGLNVMMEKPMTTDIPQAKALLAATEAGGKTFMVNNTANWRKNSRIAHEWVNAGEIGTVKQVNCYMGSPLGALFEDPKSGGWVKPTGAAQMNGFGWGQASHTLAWVFQVTGLEPAKAYADMILSEHSGADIFNAAVITCTNGAIISVTGVATLPVQAAVEGDVTTATKQIDNKLFGTEGIITYSGLDLLPDSGDLVLRRHDGREKTEKGFEFENYDAKANSGTGPESLHAFIDACLGRPSYNGANAVIGLRTAQAIDAMYRSVKSGQPVSIHLD